MRFLLGEETPCATTQGVYDLYLTVVERLSKEPCRIRRVLQC